MKPKLQFIESLEARVAPAILVNGGNLLGGTGNPNTGETSTGANTLTLVKVLSGQALVFFDNGTITGISVGKHAKLDITGNIAGDIVTNLGPNGRLTDSDNNPINGEDGGLLLPNPIKGVTTHVLGDQNGDIGRVIAGGKVSGINIAGQIAGIYAGDGIFQNSDNAVIKTGRVDINTVEPGLQNTFTLNKGATAPNAKASISNVTVTTAAQLQIFAGNGASTDQGTGVAGGSITNVTIQATQTAEGTNPVVFLHAGDGGAGTGKGGVGGAITSFNDQGSIAYVRLQTGHGGSASDGTGGDGGSFDSSTVVTSSPRYDILMGDGGVGQHGGNGGSIGTLNFTNNVTGGKSLIATGDFNHDGLADVVLLNTLSGESTVSLGTAPSGNPVHPNFQVALQTVTQTDGSQVQTPFLPTEGGNPTSLVVADFNGDNLLDFAVSYSSTDSIGVYTNQNVGHFAASRLDLAVSPTRIAAGDFAGTGHVDLAIVSSGTIATSQFGQSSQVFLARNDGAGHLTVDATAAATVPGLTTDAAATRVYDPAGTGATIGTNLYVGLKNGEVSPVQFRNGAATVVGSINAFDGVGGVQAPVDSVDALGFQDGTTRLLAFSHDLNAKAIAAGNTALTPKALVRVFNFDGNGQQNSALEFNPTTTTVRARFIQDSSFIGTVAPEALSVWGVLPAATGSPAYSILGTLGSDGNLSDFDVAQINGTYQFAASGAANNAFFFTTGVPNTSVGINPFQSFQTPFQPRLISFASGNGGDGDSRDGGSGGGIKAITFTQTLGGGVLEAGGAYNVALATGHGGTSNGADGGSGGDITKSKLSLNPGYLTTADDTTTASFLTGAGGDGTSGGKGGGIKKVASTSVFSQTYNGQPIFGSVAVRMFTGDGGDGTTDAGGNGGNLKLAGQAALSGVTFVDAQSLASTDPGLFVESGRGGDGVTAGGAGGNLTNVGSQNALISGTVVNSNQLASALLLSGTGGSASEGNGGTGGSITKANVVVSRANPVVIVENQIVDSVIKDGSAQVVAGAGGQGGGMGGAGGSVVQSVVGSGDGDSSIDRPTGLRIAGAHKNYGIIVTSGAGGAGNAGGGAGGNVEKLQLNSPSDSTLYAAVVSAGNGGDALGAGTGGAGGSVAGIKQVKDVNSSINVIQAGNGGHGAGDIGGLGGSVSDVSTVGFLGLPSTTTANLGAFYNLPSGVPASVSSLFAYSGIPQGVFAGQGADGAENGSVLNIVARQIAAIGATVQSNGTFALARTVDNVTADLIGYQVNRSANGQDTSPSTAVPVDGFILASEVTNLHTIDNDRTAQFTFNG